MCRSHRELSPCRGGDIRSESEQVLTRDVPDAAALAVQAASHGAGQDPGLPRVRHDAPAAVVLVDTATAQVTYSSPAARAMCPAELPCDAGEWARRAGFTASERPGDCSPLVAAARGEAVRGAPLVVPGGLGHGDHDTSTEGPQSALWVTAYGLPDVPGLHGAALVVFLPVEPGVTGGPAREVPARALVAAGLSVAISDATRPDNPLLWVNPAFTTMTGYAEEEVVGRSCRFLQGPATDPGAVADLAAGVARREPVQRTLLNYRKDGTAFWNEVCVSPVFDGAGVLTHFVGVQSDVTLRVEAERQREEHLAAEYAARRHAEQVQERLAFLADATAALAATLDVHEALSRLVGLSVPRLGDWCVVDFVAEGQDGHSSQVVAAHADPDRDGLVREVERLQRRHRDGDAPGPQVLAGGAPVLRRHVDAASVRRLAGRDDLAQAYDALGCSSVLVVPLAARHQVLGALTLVRSGGEPYGDTDLDTALDLARRAALIVDNARLYAREHQVAEALQRSMLPRIPDIAGLEICARYLPGTVGAQVGGDWYDVLHLPDGSVGVAIGDVMGHDLSAAAAMGQLRSVLRSYAWQRQSPAEVLDSLDQLVQGLDMAQLATAVFGRLVLSEDAAGRVDGARLSWANAGHLPPLAVLPDGRVETLSEAWSVLIGAPGGTPRRECDVMLPAGTSLVLYTDGLVESRHEDVDAGLDRLASALAEVADSSCAEEMCDRLLDGLDPASREDDVALLVVRLTAGTEQGAEDGSERSTLEVPAVPASASRVRRHCRHVLDGAPAEALETVLLLASELVGNAITHASGPIALSVDRGPEVVRVEVADRTAHLPVPREERPGVAVDPALDRGRGLVLLEALASSWGAVPTETGKRVWFEVPLS